MKVDCGDYSKMGRGGEVEGAGGLGYSEYNFRAVMDFSKYNIILLFII